MNEAGNEAKMPYFGGGFAPFFRWWSGRKLPSGGFANFSALVTDDPYKTMRCISLCIPFQSGKIDLEMIYFNCHLHILQCCGKELGFLSGSGFPGRVCIWSPGQNMWRMPRVVLCPHPNFLQTPRAEKLSVEPQGLAFRTLTGDLLATLGVVGRPQIGEKTQLSRGSFLPKTAGAPWKKVIYYWKL